MSTTSHSNFNSIQFLNHNNSSGRHIRFMSLLSLLLVLVLVLVVTVPLLMSSKTIIFWFRNENTNTAIINNIYKANTHTQPLKLKQKEIGEEVIRRKMTLVGGYSPVPNISSNEEISRVTNYAFLQLCSQQLQEQQISFAAALQQGKNNDDVKFQTIPLEAYQQVVAGTNFRVTFGIFMVTEKEDLNVKKCVGGITATVYQDLMGNLSVMNWGDEISCDQVDALCGKLNGIEGDE